MSDCNQRQISSEETLVRACKQYNYALLYNPAKNTCNLLRIAIFCLTRRWLI
jgi:hypothetical protein